MIEEHSELLAVLRQMPGNCLILKADVPHFTIAELSEQYALTTGVKYDQLIGQGIFEAFPDNSSGIYPSGARQLLALLTAVVRTGQQQEMPLTRYDVQYPGTTVFHERYWKAINQPVIIKGKVVFIIHHVEDMTEKRRLTISEQYFRGLADQMPAMLWRSAGKMCNYVNKAWLDFTGLTFEESMGEGFSLAFHPDDLPGQRAHFATACMENEPFESKFRVRSKSGEYRWVMVRACPQLTEMGTVEYVGTLVDIHDGELIKQTIQENENRLDKILNSISQITWTNDVHGRVTFYNEQSGIYCGADLREATEFSMVVHAEDLEITAQNFKRIIQNGTPGEFESRYRSVTGEYRWFLNHLKPVKNVHGEIELWVGTATDIHQLKLLQEQKEDFISIASHEIKTPVTSLKLSLQLLNKVKDDPSAKLVPALIAQANRGVEKVSMLIEDLLSVGKLSAKQPAFKKESFNIANLVEDCLQHIRIEGLYHILTTGALELKVLADQVRIEQVVLNLVNNATKYAANSKEIKILISRTGPHAKIEVTDFGHGIPKDKLPFIFDRYYRIESAGENISGLGLGLFICADIIRKHQGQIGVESELGQHTTFWFTLPLAEA